LSSCTGKSLIGYDELHKFSVDDPVTFWPALRDFTKISGDKAHLLPHRRRQDAGRLFFPGAKLNFAEPLLRGPPDL
jgi:acetoacetyl-CoA synthetase